MMAKPPHQIPETPRDPYTGPDLFTTLPSEALIKIFSFLHSPGDRKWRDKRALKAIHLVRHPDLCRAVREEMSRYLTLNFSYRDHVENGAWVWEIPKLIQFVEQEEDFREFIKPIRVRIKPLPERTGKVKLDPRVDLPSTARKDCSRFIANRENRLVQGARFTTIRPTFGYDDEPNTTTTDLPNFRRQTVDVD
jgi:hypothetical protein